MSSTNVYDTKAFWPVASWEATGFNVNSQKRYLMRVWMLKFDENHEKNHFSVSQSFVSVRKVSDSRCRKENVSYLGLQVGVLFLKFAHSVRFFQVRAKFAFGFHLGVLK